MVRIAGRKEVVGRPFLYATTRDFLMHFGLRGLAELPPLEEFEETFGGEARGGDSETIAPDPGAMGLVSTAEAEAALGTATFDQHEPTAANDGGANDAGADRLAASGVEGEVALPVAASGDGEVEPA